MIINEKPDHLVGLFRLYSMCSYSSKIYRPKQRFLRQPFPYIVCLN